MKLINKIRATRGQVLMIALWTLRASARATRMTHAYRNFIARKIKRCGLFDPAFYLEVNADVAADDVTPEYHYVAYGDRENRQPMPLFDPGYYRAQSPGRLARVNSLMHYMLIGRYHGISPSPWFDITYYLSNNKDVARSDMDPLYHYLRFGGLEGRSPSQQFDGAYYLHANPDVAMGGFHPLLHYLRLGRLENRPARPIEKFKEGENEVNVTSMLPLEEDWTDCNVHDDAKVDVIVPMYKGRAETLRCLLSVVKSRNKIPFELIVVNDASPDSKLVEDIERLAARGLFTLLSNENNLGFVAAVNRGMTAHPERDKVLLNSDAEVYNDWLDRLVAAAYRHPGTATVTPLSNNATICSYPQFLQDNPYPLELSYAELDRLTANVNTAVEVEAPTGVGFCMYIRRDCLNETGYFDERSFPQGYGEENDFCQRAIQNGWRNIIAADVFVRHLGAVSFRGEKGKHLTHAMNTISRLHPNYHHDVREFIKRDPLAPARARLDWERLKAGAQARNILMVCHNRGGGSERHLQEDTRAMLKEENGIYYLRPQRGDPCRARITSSQALNLPNLPSFYLPDTADFVTRLKELRITRIHNYGMVDFEAQAPLNLLKIANDLHVPLWYDIHDYKVICPRINLAIRDGRYCGEPREEECNKCLRLEGNDFRVEDIRGWRSIHHQVLRASEEIFVPDQDVSNRLLRYYPDIKITISPHEDIVAEGINFRQPILKRDERLRIAVIGALGKIKGYDVLRSCADYARSYKLPLEFILMGYSLNDRALERAGVTVTGRYLDQEAEEKLCTLAPHVVWLPSLWPETYSYTLSLALKCGYWAFAFDIGVIAARLRRVGLARFIMPLNMIDDARGINGRFLAVREESVMTDKKRA